MIKKDYGNGTRHASSTRAANIAGPALSGCVPALTRLTGEQGQPPYSEAEKTPATNMRRAQSIRLATSPDTSGAEGTTIAHGLCYPMANRGLCFLFGSGLCVATVDLRTAVVCSGIWAHGQALDALRGLLLTELSSWPCDGSPAQGVPWGGCHNRMPHPPAGSFYGVNNRLHGPAHCN
jgi:hypothetical protein